MSTRHTTMLLLAIAISPAYAQKPRARALGIPLPGIPGPLNAITDVAGVAVGHATIIEGDGPLIVGMGPVRTGVTAIFPRGPKSGDPVFGAWFTLNGNGEMTGTTYLEENGYLWGPVMTTNTSSLPELVGDVALTVDPYDVAAMSQAIRALDADDALRARLSAMGPGQAALFSPENYQQRLGAVYDRILK